ncbi:hypothetical protein Dimus_028452 [Dionaea muscipula]
MYIFIENCQSGGGGGGGHGPFELLNSSAHDLVIVVENTGTLICMMVPTGRTLLENQLDREGCLCTYKLFQVSIHLRCGKQTRSIPPRFCTDVHGGSHFGPLTHFEGGFFLL